MARVGSDEPTGIIALSAEPLLYVTKITKLISLGLGYNERIVPLRVRPAVPFASAFLPPLEENAQNAPASYPRLHIKNWLADAFLRGMDF